MISFTRSLVFLCSRSRSILTSISCSLPLLAPKLSLHFLFVNPYLSRSQSLYLLTHLSFIPAFPIPHFQAPLFCSVALASVCIPFLFPSALLNLPLSFRSPALWGRMPHAISRSKLYVLVLSLSLCTSSLSLSMYLQSRSNTFDAIRNPALVKTERNDYFVPAFCSIPSHKK